MSTAEVGTFSGGIPQDASAPSGRISIQPKVREKVVRQVASGMIGVPRGSISVDVHDGSKGLSLRLLAPLLVPGLDDTAAIQSVPTVFERAASIQQRIRDDVGRLLGRSVARVDLIVTGAHIAEKKRVK